MNAIVGEGKYRFELVADWVKPPAGWTIGQTGIVTDSKDRVYLFNRSDHPMQVFDPDGNFLESWGEGLYTSAHHLGIDRKDNLFLPVWAAHVIAKCTTAGKQLAVWGKWNEPADPRYKEITVPLLKERATKVLPPFTLPTDIVEAQDGSFFITDGYGNARIHHFSADGKLLNSFGQPGTGDGEFRLPHSIKQLSDGRLVVSDRENDRLQIWDPEGKFLEIWPGFNNPAHIFIDEYDTVFVAEGTGFHPNPDPQAFMQIRDKNGKMVTGWKAPLGAPGHAVWMDSRGDLYVGQNKEGQRMVKYLRR
jgi:streptogramin lyase